MYNYFVIKVNMFNKITIDDIIKLTGLNYGILDPFFIIERNKTGNYTILFDEKCAGTGLEFHIEKNKIMITMYYISTKHELELLYKAIKLICDKLKIKTFYKNDKRYNLNNIDELLKEDIDKSSSELSTLEKKVYLTNMEYITILGAINPFSLGKDEFDIIDGDLLKYQDYLHKLQHKNLIIPSFKFYDKKTENRRIALLNIFEGDRVLINEKPILGNSGVSIDECYVGINSLYILKYKDFINNVERLDKYDATSFIVYLDHTNMPELIKYNIDINTFKRLDTPYFGEIIDDYYNHTSFMKRKNLGVQNITGCNHISVFFKYAYLNDMFDKKFLDIVPELDEIIKNNSDLREYMINNINIQGQIRIGFFKKKYHDFIHEYYKFNCSTGFPSDVDKMTEKKMGTDEYNSEKYQDEAYLYLDYNQEYYDNLSNYIDKRFKKYNKK